MRRMRLSMLTDSELVHRSMTRRFALHVLLVLTLLFTQHVGSAHLSAHAAASISQHGSIDKGTLQACEQCSLFAALGSSPPQTPFQFEIEPPRQDFVPCAVHSFNSYFQSFYRSRAPPVVA